MAKKNADSVVTGDKEYFAEAKKWEVLYDEMRISSARKAWWVASIGVVIGVLGMSAAFVQATQDPPAPVVLRVGENNGVVDIVNKITDGKELYSEVLDKAFSQKYVRFREAYARNTAEEYYRGVGLMSSPAVQENLRKLSILRIQLRRSTFTDRPLASKSNSKERRFINHTLLWCATCNASNVAAMRRKFRIGLPR